MALGWCAECTRHSVDPQPQSTCPTAPAARLELPPGAPAAGIVPRSWQVLAVGNYPPACDVWRSQVAALPPPANCITVEWHPWDGEAKRRAEVNRLRRVPGAVTRAQRWEPAPAVSLSRCLCVLYLNCIVVAQLD